MKKLVLFLSILTGFTMPSLAYDFQSDNLLYSIISTNPPRVSLNGHVDGTEAQGELVIPETVTYEDVVYTVTTIEESAFYMSHITSVVFPVGLTAIEAYAFESCRLTSLHIPATLTSIGDYAFVDNKFESITVDEANPIYDSRDNCNALIETATNTLITGCINTIIPHSVVVLGSGAFIHCERLKSINIPECITRIENNVFEDCDSLETVVLPASLTFIGNHAFCYCYGITSITSKATTPPAATYNPDDPYYYDTFLGVNRTIPIYIPFGTIQAYSQAEGWNRFSNFIEEEPIIYTIFEPDTCFTLQYPDTIYWDLNQDGTNDIYFYLVWHSAGGYMTYMKPLANWKWSNSIKVDQNLWQPLTDTTMIDESLYWESDYSFINNYETPEWWHFAFRHQAEDGIHYGWMHFSNIGYCSCCISSMGYCTLPDQPIQWGQTELLGMEDFQSDNLLYSIINTNPPCVSLNGHVDGTAAQGELVIPETVTYEGHVYTVTEIADSAFMRCSGLTGVLSIPPTIQIIGKRAFSGCSGFSELVFHDGLLEICEEAFYGCSGFTGTLDFPETVIRIKYAAFRGCNGFSGDLVFPNSLQSLGDTKNKNHVDETAWSVVANCFEHLFLPPSLDTIGPYCFAGCSRLKGDLIIPDNVKVIYYNAFGACSGFTSLSLGNSLVIIDKYAFAECSGIKGTVVIPEVYEIGINAFDRCRAIQELILPTHVPRLHQNVFVRCSSLTEIDIPEGWTHTGNGTFYQCSNLQRVHLPESLITIGDDCFAQCTKLEEINIPEGVTTIGELAFEKCESLENIELPANLRQLDQGAFAYCTKLKGKMVIPDKVQRLDAYELLETPGTFESCSLLTCIVLGDSINSIDEGNFRNTQLDSLVIKAVTPPTLIRNTYGNSWHFPTDCHIVVPCGSLEAYQNSESWHNFTQITEDCGIGFNSFTGSEWYYEILNDDGSITYQYLMCAGDTTINEERPKVLVRSNTQYDRGETTEITHEYLYERNGIVYWWNKTLEEFTILYDLTANVGDEWEIKVGTETITMHVDAVDYYEYEGQTYRMLHVSDSANVFSGNIVCGIGHLTSFFPERLMSRGRGYRVEGLRCYWVDGGLVFNPNRVDCDAIYSSLHNVDEQIETTFAVYPNPTNGVLFVETRHGTSLPDQNDYRITNIMGQNLLQGTITGETQQINIELLPAGMYFITFAGKTQKFIVK